MRLVNAEIDKSLKIKLDKSIIALDENVGGIMSFGEKNDYPQVIEKLINNSVTAKAVSRVYAKFLTGAGFENEELNKLIIGKDNRGKKITLRSLLSQVAFSVAYHNGLWIHCNVNLAGKIGTVKFIPFKFCRFAKIDDKGYTAKIGVYENWDKQKDQKFDKHKIVWYNCFNLESNVLAAQVKEVKGMKNYKGQVYFHFFDNQYLYPLSPFDPVYMDADTEYQIELFKNRTIRNGMMNKTVMRVAAPANDTDRRELKEKIESFIGPDGDSVIVLEDDVDPVTGDIKSTGAFKVDEIKANIDDKLFQNWEKGLANNIRKSMAAIPAILIDYEESKLGTTSGEAINQATNFYNAVTKDDRTQLEEIFQEIFINSANEELANNTNWKIKPLNLYENGTTAQPGTTATN
jgi:hypothetical protein